MSMLSAQCDELRSMAESVGLAMPQAATLMMEAADTIERLREQAEDMDFQLDKWQTKAEYFKQLADLAEAENAKLRELVHRLISHVEHPPCEGCMAEMNCDGEHVTQCDEWLFMVADARKLGVEVTA